MFSSTEYNNLINIFEENKNKKWDEWLEFDSIFDNQGKQGIVGILTLKDPKHDKKKIIFKISQCINFLANHELMIMKGLSELNNYCPHFCKGLGILKCNIEPNRKAKNPFKIKSKYAVEKEVLLLELVEKSSKFYSYIKSPKIHEEVLYSIVKQTLMAINIAQKHKNFTHYDLHSNNIMIKKCYKDLVFVYKIDEENQFCVPSYGYYPIIIDFGFSYIENMEDNPLWTSLCHTDVGFMSDRFDWVADPKLFLITVSDEIKEKRGTKKSKCLRRIVRNVFYPLKIELDSGWDDVDKKGAIDYVLDILQTFKNPSRIFNDCEYYCLDILQSLIILPLEEQSFKNIGKYFKTFIKEWVKIENEISNEFYNLYILKEIVNVARNVRADYMDEETREIAIDIFRKGVYSAIEKVTKFCNPKNINFEKFLCSLFLLSQNIEGILYDIISVRMIEKEKEYEKMPLKNIEQIYGAIDVNIPDEYKYNENTVFLIMDCVNKDHKLFEIPNDEIDNINEMKNMMRGTYVYDLYMNSI
jgi:hypothetical protein